MNQNIYLFGLIVVSVYVLFGIDDLIWDLFCSFKRHDTSNKIDIAELDRKPSRLLAIMIAAWHEEAVIGDVIENIIESVQYPKSMYHIFLGVYPNDEATMAEAQKLQSKYPNVHMVINKTPGPTCKADNINNIISNIRDFEKKMNWKFMSVTVHDSEDVVHPYEFKVTNYLIDDYDALQFPVFPLQEMPKLSNFFKNMTVGTYADEFAENHYRTMVMRDAVSAVVPSAGTGFVLSRRILDYFGAKDIFPDNSLTEDYKLSVTLATLGFKVHYVLEKVSRLMNDGKVKYDYISTRSMFPSTFAAAVRQKTRWIYGITIQSVRPIEIFTLKNLNLASRLSLYKDMKANIGNLIVFPGYMIFIYFIVSFFIDLPVIFPMYSLSWWLSIVLTIMMIERQMFRIIAVNKVYGFRSVVISCLLPPVIPIRLVWGNIINMTATLRAWKQYFIKERKSKFAAPVKQKWSKTDHEFLAKSILQRYHRNLGDVLLEKGFIQKPELEKALQESLESAKKLGEVLIGKNTITEMQLLNALASVKGTVMIPKIEMYITHQAITIEKQTLLENIAFPVINRPGICMLAVCADSSEVFAQEFSKMIGKKIQLVYAPKEAIINAINTMNLEMIMNSPKTDYLIKLLDFKNISEEQVLLVQKNSYVLGMGERYTLTYMGLTDESYVSWDDNESQDDSESELPIYMAIMPQQAENQISSEA